MTPPLLARALLRAVLSRADVGFVEQDLADAFAEVAERKGRKAARWWYWKQVLTGVAWRMRPDPVLLSRGTWSGWAGDVRVALRVLRRRPAYAVGVVGTLALGLGAAGVVAAVAWGVWLSPMPFPDPDRVVRLYEVEPPKTEAVGVGTAGTPDEGAGRRWRVSPPLLEDLRRNEWAAIQAVSGVSIDGFDWERDGRTERLTSLKVSPEAFGILGIEPVRGGLLAESEPFAVLLTRDFWLRTFAGDPGIVGTTLQLDGIAREVAGIVDLPAGYPQQTDVVTPLRFAESQLVEGMRGARYLDVIARVRPGRSVADAEAELESYMQALGSEHPQHAGWSADVVVLGENLVASFRGVLGLLLSAGLLFLALAIVNVGGLAAARRAETLADRAVRLALGASEGRILRATMVESILLGLAGGVGAALLTRWALPVFGALAPSDVPRLAAVAIGPTEVAALLLLGMTGGAFVGLLGHVMTRGGGGPRRQRTTTTPGLRGRQLLVAGQVALTTLLTTGGVTILRHVTELRGVDVGFEPESVIGTPLMLSDRRFPDEESRRAVWLGIREGLAERGLVAAVAVNPPMAGSNMPYGFQVDGEERFAQYHAVTADYFDVMGIPVVDGRTFDPRNANGGEDALVINQALADAHFPGGDAVGRELALLGRPTPVIGVVGSTRHFGPDAEPPFEVYRALAQDPWWLGTVLVRSERSDVAAVLSEVVAAIDPAIVIPTSAPYTEHLSEWYAPLRLQLVLVGTLSALGLLLASLGLYALITVHVASRRREIGIRMALGAPADRVFRSVVSRGSGLAAGGALSGLAGWYMLAPRAGDLLDGIDATSPLIPFGVCAIVGTAAVLALLAPAWRSTTVDPATTLQSE